MKKNEDIGNVVKCMEMKKSCKEEISVNIKRKESEGIWILDQNINACVLPPALARIVLCH
jgi:hypothetical protein